MLIDEISSLVPTDVRSGGDNLFMNAMISELYDDWLAKTAGDPIAAATLVLATVQAGQNATNGGHDSLMNLDEAAKYLGYKPAGLRKLVKARQITSVQNGNGPIKFKREWLDDYIALNANSPSDFERSPVERRTRRKPAKPESRFGFDPSLYQN